MIKNTSGQKIGVQMVSATDGSAFTGSVTVAVTIDAGTQATGSVGSGACAHEGNGYHTYAPAQAETNGTLIAFTFTGTGAVPATVQVFTTGFDPTAAVVPANVTQFGGSAGTFASGIPETKVASIAAGAVTAAAIAQDAIDADAIAADAVTEIQSGLSTLTAADVRTAVGLASANLDTQLTAIDDAVDTEVASVLAAVDTEVAAIKAKTDNLPSDPADASDIAALLATITGYIDTEVASILAAVDTEVGAIKTVTDQLVAAQTEPSAVPAANATPLAKIAWLAALARNRVTQTATTQTVYADDGTTAIAAATVSDDATTYVRGEFA